MCRLFVVAVIFAAMFYVLILPAPLCTILYLLIVSTNLSVTSCLMIRYGPSLGDSLASAISDVEA